MPTPSSTLRIFLAHSAEDKPQVREIAERLRAEGYEPWLDEDEILPGQSWEQAVDDAVRSSDVILVLLTRKSLNKEGYVQREIRTALALSEGKPEGTTIIPVRLEETEVPRALGRFHWLDLFREDGWRRLHEALEQRRSTFQRQLQILAQIYKVDNVRTLLLEEFNVDQLRRLIYDSPPFRSLYDSASTTQSKLAIVDQMLLEAAKESDIETILDWARHSNPSGYDSHRPYYQQRDDTRIGRVPAPTTRRPLDNPYVVGNPIQPENTKVFLGRFDVANTILSEMRKGGQKPSILLYGRRRMGKSSALLNIQRLVRDPSLINVYISGQSVRYHNDNDFCYFLSREIRESLQKAMIDTSRIDQRTPLSRESYSDQPLLAMTEFFELYNELLHQTSLHCLVSIDEYEEIDYHMRNRADTCGISRGLLVLLRDTLQHRARFNFLFAGTHFLRDLSNVDWASIFINVKTLHISFLNPDDSAGLLTKPVPSVEYEPRALVKKVVALTGGQPFLLQAVASELIDILNMRRTRLATPDNVDAAIEAAVVKHGAYFDFLWDQECEGERRKRLVKRVASGRNVLVDDVRQYEEELRDLIRKEILRISGNLVALTMPIFRTWMENNQHLL